MGSFHCYCAICSCSLNSYEVGSKTPAALRRRRARIARRVYWQSKGLNVDETEDEDEDAKEERLQSMPEADAEPESEEDLEDDDAESFYSDTENYSYDPELLTDADLDWFRHTGGLGVNDADSNAPKHYIAAVNYDDCNVAYISNNAGDKNAPADDTEVYLYYPHAPDYVLFPFHWSCLELLSRAISGSPDYKALDKKTLYDVMLELCSYSALNLPYGDINGPDQDWQSVAGEEYTARDPLDKLAFEPSIIMNTFKAPDSTESAPLNLSSKVRTDPFKALPAEITDMILDHLPVQSLPALLTASWIIYSRAQHPTLWKRRIEQDMPWLWQLRTLAEEHKSWKPDYKRLYLFVDKVTTPRFGMRTWLALANRRRIWGACEFLAEKYHRKMQEVVKGGAT